ncbi:hypothetical protein BpHYR1_041775 [Brachionus plicatilis]|uniref:Uncharacterized protein n=1 Tax=Brachionus plicatilis TaxID=10195 RepID=A0A3M7PPL4_BRAPC|nr:hypothetical protein BpHYR1_041775 [Brachionus plicatilis]
MSFFKILKMEKNTKFEIFTKNFANQIAELYNRIRNQKDTLYFNDNKLVLFYTFRLIKQVFLEISFLNIILASTKSDNPLYIYVVFYIKIYPNRPP